MEPNFDERHYVTPRIDRGPLHIPSPGPPPLVWCVAVAVAAVSVALLYLCW